MLKKYFKSKERWIQDDITQDVQILAASPLVLNEELTAENVITAKSLHVPIADGKFSPDNLKPLNIPKKRGYSLIAASVNNANAFLYKMEKDEENTINIELVKEYNDSEIENHDTDLNLPSSDIIVEEEIDSEKIHEYNIYDHITNDIEAIEVSSSPIAIIDEDSNDTSGVSTLTTLIPLTNTSNTSSLNEDYKIDKSIVLDKNDTSNNNSVTSLQSLIIYDNSTVLDVVQDNIAQESVNTDVTGSNSKENELQTNNVINQINNNDNNNLNNVDLNSGDILWAQIYNYCYWPCIVHPEPNTNIFVKKDTKNLGRHYTSVHVRFLAEKGSRNWVKGSNIMQFRGYENYLEILEEIKQKHGIHSSKFKNYIPVKYKQKIWFRAISEAEFLTNFNSSDRLMHFYNLQNITSVDHVKDEELQPYSKLIKVFEMNSADLATSNDYVKCIYSILMEMNREFKPKILNSYPGKKRKLKNSLQLTDQEEDESVYKWTNPRQRKRIKLEAIDYTYSDWDDDLMSEALFADNIRYKSEVDANTDNNDDIFCNLEFNKFFHIIKDYIIPIDYGQIAGKDFTRSICKSVRHLWATKCLYTHFQQSLEQEQMNDSTFGLDNFGRDEKPINRLSNRLKSIRGSQTPNDYNNGVKKYNRRVSERNISRLLRMGTSTSTNSISDTISMLGTESKNFDDTEAAGASDITTFDKDTDIVDTEEDAVDNNGTWNDDNKKLRQKVRYTKRPMEELIDDIFNLDRKYLFKGLSKSPVCRYCLRSDKRLIKCAKRCPYWLHVECLQSNSKQESRKINNSTKESRSRNFKSRNKKKRYKEEANNEEKAEVIADLLLEEQDQINLLSSTQNDEVGDIFCAECNETNDNDLGKCMICEKSDNTNEEKDEDQHKNQLVECKMPNCYRTFHPKCCRYWPQAKLTISKKRIESFRCPSHVCHTCVSDDPKGKYQQLNLSQIVRCIRCPASYHSDSTCIPAGSEILTASYIVCPRHSSQKIDMTVNVNWCFICVGGGQLICCETCPTAAHAQCLKLPDGPDELYICEECESGRMPLYGEIVWAKFKVYRWWPAIILPPTEVPLNIRKRPHQPADFVVRFFGSHNYGWISKRRVYLYMEGDCTQPPKVKKGLDVVYNRAVEEAKLAYELIKKKKQEHSINDASKGYLQPEPYVRIRINRAVSPVKFHIDMEKVNKCECDPLSEHPCGPETNCLNRVLYHECNPKICPAGTRCENRMFESRISPRLEVVNMNKRGFGLICREPIKSGTFIIEYVGEIINSTEFQERLQQKLKNRDENFYFLSVEKDHIIDAGSKGNLSRFLNHSCDPNCETQKWLVNSLIRIGLFAIKDIEENTELTFNYHWDDLLGTEKVCYCGAANCSGQLGGGGNGNGNTNVVNPLNDDLKSKDNSSFRNTEKRHQKLKQESGQNRKSRKNSLLKTLEKNKLFNINLAPYLRQITQKPSRRKKNTMLDVEND